ncbi:MAG: hypothetical protein QXD62_03560 [Candidatus Woesearchaeota archaeon]
MKPSHRLAIVLLSSFVIFIVVLYIYHLSSRELKILKYESFEIVIQRERENIINPSKLRVSDRGFIYVKNITGFHKDISGRAELRAMITIYTADGIKVYSKLVFLPPYPVTSENQIPLLKVPFDLQFRPSPGIYVLKLALIDIATEQMFEKETIIMIE